MRTNLIPIDDGVSCPFPFFGECKAPAEKVYKIYNDGGHYVATECGWVRNGRKPKELVAHNPADKRTAAQKEKMYSSFMRNKRMENDCKKLFFQAQEKRLHNSGDDRSMTDFINARLLEKYPHCSDLSAYVEQKIIKFRNPHYIDTVKFTDTKSADNGGRPALDILFDSLYFDGLKKGLRDGKLDRTMTDYIKAGILKLYPDIEKRHRVVIRRITNDKGLLLPARALNRQFKLINNDLQKEQRFDLNDYIEKKLKAKRHNFGVRKKRFRRKAYLNKWNYFVTFTYDDSKQTAESFRKKLRRCLSNLHTRRGWRYMGVFECAPDTGRLHFHGLLYVPAGEMIGTITEKQDYSTAQKRMQTYHENDFFQAGFGRNDFVEINDKVLKHSGTIDYILKYIGKTGERITYSRGIPTEIYKKLTDESIITEFTDFVRKCVLFDNVIDYEQDIARNRYYRQMTVIDLLCNPPRTA